MYHVDETAIESVSCFANDVRNSQYLNKTIKVKWNQRYNYQLLFFSGIQVFQNADKSCPERHGGSNMTALYIDSSQPSPGGGGMWKNDSSIRSGSRYCLAGKESPRVLNTNERRLCFVLISPPPSVIWFTVKWSTPAPMPYYAGTKVQKT